MKDTVTTTVQPFLVTDNCKKAVEFYSTAFGAVELFRFKNDNEKLISKIAIEGAEFWLSDEEPEFNNLSPTTVGGSAVRMIDHY